MNKPKSEFYQKVLTKTQYKRMSVIDEYLNIYGEMISTKKISPNRVFETLADKYDLTKIGVRIMLCNAGVYKNRNNPICFPTPEEKAAKPTYFFE